MDMSCQLSACGQCDNLIKIIFCARGLPTRKAAGSTAVSEGVHARFCFNAYGLHKPAAPFGAVARGYIHMLAPEACGAVVRVAVTNHIRTTVLSSEVFYSSSKILHKKRRTPCALSILQSAKELERVGFFQLGDAPSKSLSALAGM